MFQAASISTPVTLRGLHRHTSGTDDGFGFPGYAPEEPRPTPVQILNGEPPSRVHKLKGYGFAAMTNSDGGGALVRELQQRVAAAYRRDTLDQPLRR